MKTVNLSEELDIIFAVSLSNKGENGEDCFCCGFKECSAFTAVFDGCGGSGSSTYPGLGNKTGAYLASRLASGAVYDWFHSIGYLSKPDEEFLLSLREYLQEYLLKGKEKGGETSRLRGAMVKDFPTTMALSKTYVSDSGLNLQAVWCGDSRVYILNADGIGQFTEDDTNGTDAYEDIRTNPAMRNAVTANGNYKLHNKRITLKEPVLILSATDGYFDYWNTPMHFEYLILETLEHSNSPDEWKRALIEQIREATFDDATLSVMGFGFGSFKALKALFHKRYRYIDEVYMKPMQLDYSEVLACRLWQSYKSSYERFLTDRTGID